MHSALLIYIVTKTFLWNKYWDKLPLSSNMAAVDHKHMITELQSKGGSIQISAALNDICT